MKPPKSPCTRNCPDRTAECRKNCVKAAEYFKQKLVYYEQKSKRTPILSYSRDTKERMAKSLGKKPRQY